MDDGRIFLKYMDEFFSQLMTINDYILENSHENPCDRVSFLIKLQLKKRLWHRCFHVNIAKFLRTSFL